MKLLSWEDIDNLKRNIACSTSAQTSSDCMEE
jgi:hypothetical protein